MIQSVENLQEVYAKALIVDRIALERAQAEDVLAEHRALLGAFHTDIRPLCARVPQTLAPLPIRPPPSGPTATQSGVADSRAGG
jgi:L-rhamnose isomerase/sugar isomerase